MIRELDKYRRALREDLGCRCCRTWWRDEIRKWHKRADKWAAVDARTGQDMD